MSVALVVLGLVLRFYVVVACAYLALFAWIATTNDRGELAIVLQPWPALGFAGAVVAIAVGVV